ncbi:hypothetical protein [Pectobacterium parmentieri]|uniref:hypothetical protein n=1 Tax=Pectobacterium parmentieri TaxID=1905730 RepID=UPI0018DF15B4|nr:hypothetical protein [Pectobacterium parmentieri]MBI0552262.1 hypothetical protein [Pectobacterium parmentieri]MBI0561321.1 hypothetical protein [Pectobacterium parmentieri]MBI0565526.1 hypothetical protein [Pectobacterium parmentieri]
MSTTTAGSIATSEDIDKIEQNGAFVRQNNHFPPFGDGPDELPVEADRYRLLWTPFALGPSCGDSQGIARIRIGYQPK